MSIALVQSKRAVVSETATQAIAFDSSVTAGNLLVGVFFGVEDSAWTSVTDTQSNTWAAACPRMYENNWTTMSVQIWYAIAGSSAACTVTQTRTRCTCAVIYEFSGCATVTPLDGAGGSGAGYSTNANYAIVTGSANDLVVAGVTSNGNASGMGSGYTLTTGSSYATYQHVGYNTDVSAAGTKTVTFNDVNYYWAGVAAAFKINSGATLPTLTSISPTSGGQGTTVNVTHTGTGFTASTPTINISGTGITQSSKTVVSDTSMTCNYIIAGGATASARDVTVTTVNGTSTPVKTFTVTSGSTPTLASSTPNDGFVNTVQPVTLAGTNMAGGTPSGTVSGSNVTVGNIVQSSATSWTADVTIANAAATGVRTLYITTADGDSGTVTFTIRPRSVSAGKSHSSGPSPVVSRSVYQE